MVPCYFSETQFSFCFTFEYIKQFFPLVPLPIFPNIVNEGRPGGGYDVQINGNIYFQFKIPVYFDRYSKKGRIYWNVYGHEYYRIKLETNDEQFRLLKALQNPANEVCYATPEFHTQADLSNYYAYDQIVTNSALFPIEELPPYQSGHHQLIYSPRQSWGKLFSEPQVINKVKTKNLFERFVERESNMTIYNQALQVRNILLEGEYKVSNDNLLNTDKPEQLVKEIYTILLTKFNIHWYPVISRRQII